MVGVLVGWFAHNHRVLVDRLRVAAERDFLTGLLNTRAFDAALSTRLEQGKPFGLVLGDKDNLKDVNDARIGGDEFAVITSQPGTDAVRALCSRLTAAPGAEGMSMSFGWAVCPRDGDRSLLLYRAADERFYAQKLIRSRFTAAEVVSMPTRAERLVMRSNLG